MSAESASQDSSLIELRALTIRFGPQTVLNGINLSVKKGETIAIIGESGCGKTVLMKTIIRLIRPTEGNVFFDGRNLGQTNEKELTTQRMRFGFVFQAAALFDSMTVFQNIAFPIRQHQIQDRAEIRSTVLKRISEVGLPESVLEKKPAELSGGMRKRVGLARALAMEPEVILYDEPTTGLDPIMSDVINALIIRTRSHYPVTSIVVTHDMRTARKVADRIVMLYPFSRLKSGEDQILFDGPPNTIDQTKDQRVTQFIKGKQGLASKKWRSTTNHILHTNKIKSMSIKTMVNLIIVLRLYHG